MASVDASNSCIPPSHPLYASVPPLPSTTRGERCILDGKCGRHNYDRSVLLYSNGKSVVIREMDAEVSSSVDRKNKVLIYRGHTATVTAAKFSPSGCFVASGDARGKLRVWSYDNEEHLCKLDIAALTGPIRDLSWDMDSKRICIVGERNDTSSPCTRVIQWDTGVTCGELSQHTRGRASSCDFKPNRPMRIVTGGMDDSRVYFNSGPPFTRVVDGVLTDDAHSKAVNCIKYTSDGSKIVSIGADKAIVLYDGKTMKLLDKLENVHKGNIYACAWNGSDKFILTCSADGTCKLISAEPLEVVHTWDVAEFMSGHQSDSVPIGAMLVGCTFVKDDIPVTVAINGDLTFLPKPPMLDCGIDNFKKFTGHGSPIIGMAMDPSRGVFYTADSDGALCEFSTETLTPTKRFSQPGSTDLLHKMHGDATISCLTTVAGGNVLTGGWDDTICKVSSEGNVLENAMALTAQPNAIASGTLLAVVVTVEGLVLIENASNMSAVLVFDYIPKSVCVSADDSTVYVGGEDCNIHVYKVLDEFKLEESHIIEGAHFKEIHALRLSHDNTKLASADVRDICVWDLANNYEPIVNKSKWCFHTQRIICLAWSPDDSLLASGGADDSIYLWSLNKKMRRLHYPHSHRGGVTGIEFVNGKKMMLVSVGADSCVNQWDFGEDATKKFG